jgi:exodeoxyribonuclease VII small subunit
MTKQINYQALRAELDEILQSLDDSEADVEAMTKQYQRGIEIIKQLEQYLKTAQNSVKKVKTGV